MKVHDGIVKKLGKVQYIPSFKKNMISLSKLDSISYKWRSDGGILKVLHGSRIVMRRKRYGRHYLLVGSSARHEALETSGSPMQGGAPDASKSKMRCETQKDAKRYRRVKFLLSLEAISSKSQIRWSTAHDGNGIERSGSTPMFVHS